MKGSFGNFLDVKTNFLLESDNKELLVRYKTELETNGLLYSDLNGFSMKKSTYRIDKPIAHNYFPISTSTFIEDSVFHLFFLILGLPIFCSS